MAAYPSAGGGAMPLRLQLRRGLQLRFRPTRAEGFGERAGMRCSSTEGPAWARTWTCLPLLRGGTSSGGWRLASRLRALRLFDAWGRNGIVRRKNGTEVHKGILRRKDQGTVFCICEPWSDADDT